MVEDEVRVVVEVVVVVVNLAGCYEFLWGLSFILFKKICLILGVT